jgi:hypothetical protein
MKTLMIRTEHPVALTIFHARNEFASDGDSRYVDADGQPCDTPSSRRRIDGAVEVCFADEGSLQIDGPGDIELENLSDADLDVRGDFQRLDASVERGTVLAPGSCWRVRLAPGDAVRVRHPGAADRWLARLWQRWRRGRD